MFHYDETISEGIFSILILIGSFIFVTGKFHIPRYAVHGLWNPDGKGLRPIKDPSLKRRKKFDREFFSIFVPSCVAIFYPLFIHFQPGRQSPCTIEIFAEVLTYQILCSTCLWFFY